MNISKIENTIKTIFAEKKKRIIFWYDGEKEFEDIVSEIKLDDVKIVRLDETSLLELKIEIECSDLNIRYLLYSPTHEPPPEDDWLFDIRLYSYTFHADKASIVLKELALDNQSIRPYLKQRNKFFNNKDRFNKLKKWVKPDDREDDIDLKMLSVVTRSDQPDLFTILMKVFESCCDENTFNDDISSKYWSDIEKLDLAPSFWKFAAQTFGCISEKEPGLNDFLLRIFVTDFSNQLKAKIPSSLAHFVIQDTSCSMNSTVFLSHWRSNINYFRQFNLISSHIAEKLKITDLLISFQVDKLLDVMTFAAVERRIISSLRDQIIGNSSHDYTGIQDAIKTRLDGYWATVNLDEGAYLNLYKTVYKALEISTHLFILRARYNDGFSYTSAEAMFKAYTEELFKFDQFYRNFNEQCDIAENAGWDVLKSLRQTIEDCYSGWFMDQISLKWGDFLEGDDGLLNKWRLPYICNQYDFFDRYILPVCKGSRRNRVFVIISDGFRYEAAQELTQIINGKYRMEARLDPMTGVLPSFTALGMAALLPHKKLDFKNKSANVLVDEKPSSSLDYRAQILSQHEGVAIKAENLTAMNKIQGREFIKPFRVIYIYHDQVDAVGDKAATESQTFDAVRKAIDDLSALVNVIINNLNGTRIHITADHGFVYNNKAADTIDKSVLDKSDQDLVKSHKRFVMGSDLNMSNNVYRGDTKITANTKSSMEFLLPKGTNRFNFIGGAKYYHGGASLQEIVIPVLTVRQMKGKHLEKSEINKVGVSLIGSQKKIVTNIPRFEFIQTDTISARYKLRTVKISIRDGNELISDEKTLTFDSTSSSIDERKKSVTLTLKAGQEFDDGKEYYLVLRDADDETEYVRHSQLIDVAFTSDF
ncbi:BREX-1 system phosphatase PglZ type A [Desulfobacterales bacterium HSG16]|nr:BREX-1 system phosphatase PglZ type A [Desulfobacterales bacterium HSG16]